MLRGELPPTVAPEWIEWDVAQPPQSEEEEPSSPEEDPFDDENSWAPFLQPRRKRARTVTVDESSSEDEEDEEEEAESFPYPVGTKIARDFGEHGIYWGVIEKHYPDDSNLCGVRFTDGDKEDLDQDEIKYVIQLYEKEFGVSNSE